MSATQALYQKKGETNSWVTPLVVTQALGLFDLDPCQAIGQRFSHATRHFTEIEDGLKQEWTGRVWMNPPYSSGLIDKFVQRFVEHGNGISLVFPRVETRWFQLLAGASDAMLLKKGRISFEKVEGPVKGAFLGSVFFAIGEDNVLTLKNSGIEGLLWRRL